MLKLQHFVFAVGVVCITNLVRLPAVTTYILEYSFGKRTKQIKSVVAKKNVSCVKVINSFFWVKVLQKLPVKIYGQNLCIIAIKNIILPTLPQ